MKQLLTIFFFLSISFTAFGQVLFEENSTFRSYRIDRVTLQGIGAAENGWIRGGIGQNIRWNNSTKLWEASFNGSSYSDFSLINFGNSGTLNFYTKAGNGSPYEMSNSELSNHLRLFISNTGNVGIGTSRPKAKMDVNSSGTLGRVFDPNKAYLNITNGDASLIMDPNEIYGSGALILGFNPSSVFEVTTVHDGEHTSLMRINGSGNVAIGTSNPGSNKLAVNGTIKAKEVKVTMVGWSDFVFADDYVLPPLSEVEQHIKQHKRLPAIPSEAEVLENGIELGVMNAKLLQKIEELTLYMIDMKKENEALKERVLLLESVRQISKL